MIAYQRALDTDERCIDAINALERLYRRTQAWDRLVDVLAEEVAGRRRHRAGDPAAAAGRRAVGGPPGRQRSRRRRLQGGPVGRSAEPAGAQGARRAVREDRAAWRSTSRTSSTSSRSRRPRRIASRSTSDGDDLGGEVRASPSAPPRCWRRSCSSTSATRRRTATSSACTARSGKWDALVDTYRKHIAGHGRSRPSASSCTRKMGQVYEQELRDLDRAIDAYNDVLNVEADHADALAGLARLYEETEQWDRAVEVMRRLIRISTDAEAEGRSQLPPRQDLRRADEGCRSPPRSTWSRRCRRIRRTSRRCCRCSASTSGAATG